MFLLPSIRYSGGKFPACWGNFKIQSAAVKQLGLFPCFGGLGVFDLAVRVFIFIGQEQPQADRDEADADDPFDGIGGNGFRQPYADKCGDQMIQ